MADQTVMPVRSPPGGATAYPDQQDQAASPSAGVIQSWAPGYTLVTLDVMVFTSITTSNPA